MCDLVLSLVPTMLSHQRPQEKSRSVTPSKHVQFARPLKWEQEFLETCSEEVMSIVTSSFDLNQASMKRGAQDERGAGKVLHALASTIRTLQQETAKDQSGKEFQGVMLSNQQAIHSMESDSDSGYDPLEEDCFFCAYIDRKFWSCTHRLKACFKKDKNGNRLVVCPQEVIHQLSQEEFQKTSHDALEEFLQRNYARFSHSERQHCSETRVHRVALELLDAVIDSVHGLCQPQTAHNIIVSEESLHEKALDLKNNINVILLRFFTQTDCRTVESLEEAQIISKSKLSLFALLLTDRVHRKYCLQAECERQAALLDPNSKLSSFPEAINPKRGPNEIFPTKQEYAFVAEAMTCLVKSLSFPSQHSSVNSVSSDPSGQVPEEVTNTHNPPEAEQTESEQMELLIAHLRHAQPELF